MTGESITSYVRRLARANHLRPNYLRRYLQDPTGGGGIRLDWLAVLSARPVSALERAFTSTPQRSDRRSRHDRPRQSRTDLFAVIRRDACKSGSSVRAYVSGIRPRPRRARVRTANAAIPASASLSSARRSPAITAWSPAHLAVEHQDLSRLRELLDAGHDVEDDSDGWTLLRHAIDSEYDAHAHSGQALHADLTAFLLARGANPLRQHNGMTAVAGAEIRGHWLAAEILRAWIGKNQLSG